MSQANEFDMYPGEFNGFNVPENIFTAEYMADLRDAGQFLGHGGEESWDAMVKGIEGLIRQWRSDRAWFKALQEEITRLHAENAELKAGRRHQLRLRIAQLEAELASIKSVTGYGS